MQLFFSVEDVEDGDICKLAVKLLINVQWIKVVLEHS